MNRKEYNKLIRDRIPEIIRDSGRKYEVIEMSEEEYLQALRVKLLEEAQEAFKADSQELVTELADLFEVIDALIEVCSIARESVLEKQRIRKIERGGFTKKLKLLWADS